jgi:hypothetical protein
MTEPIKDSQDFTLTDLQKKVVQNDIPMDIFEEDMERRRKLGLLNEKYVQCMRRLRLEWEPRLRAGGYNVSPTDDEFAQTVFAHPEYKNRTQRDLENPPAKIIS